MREATADFVIKFLEHQDFLVYGVPHFIICDNSQQFAEKTFKKLIDFYKVKKFG